MTDMIERLIGEMTLEEKIGQLNQVGPSPMGGIEVSPEELKRLLEDGRAEVSIPALDEIYQQLEVCGTYEFDVDQLAVNPELEIEIGENVRKSSFYAALISTAYAADKP